MRRASSSLSLAALGLRLEHSSESAASLFQRRLAGPARGGALRIEGEARCRPVSTRPLAPSPLGSHPCPGPSPPWTRFLSSWRGSASAGGWRWRPPSSGRRTLNTQHTNAPRPVYRPTSAPPPSAQSFPWTADPRRSVSVSQGTLALLLLGGVAIGGTLEHLSLAQQAVGLGVSGSLSPQPHPTRPSTNDSSFAQQDSSYARYTQHLQARQEGSPTGESLSWLSVWRWLRNQPSSQALGGAPPPQAALSPYFIAEAASRAAPGVVNILVSAPREETDIGEEASFPSAAGPGSSSGSGFLCHPDGTILTNAHVVADALPRVKGARPNFEGLAARLGPSPSAPKAVSGRLFGRASLAPAPAEQSFAQHSSLLVTLSDGRMFEGRVEHWDLVSDLAIVKIEADTPLPHIPLGRSSQLCAGQWVVALGSPLHLQNSVTAGIVSCTDRKALDLGLPGAWTEYIQTDTAINRGNSGGPLVNLEGQVVGISAMKALAADGVSFAIPIDAALDVARQLRDRGRVLRPYAGMRMLQLNPHNAAQFRKKDDAFPDVSAGILVPNVREDSPAQKAGIRAGDVIVGFQGASAQPTTRELVASLGKHIGKPLALTVVRGRERHTVSLVALEAPLMR